MRVRIRLRTGPLVRKSGTKNQQLALGFAILMVPAIVSAYAFAVWRLAADLSFAGDFAIEGGVFSHWQPWLGIAVALHGLAVALNRYGKRRPVMEIPLDPVAQEPRAMHRSER